MKPIVTFEKNPTIAELKRIKDYLDNNPPKYFVMPTEEELKAAYDLRQEEYRRIKYLEMWRKVKPTLNRK